MAAVLRVVEKNGPSGAKTDKTNSVVRIKKADNPTVDINDPVDIPVSGVARSMEKWLRLEMLSAPDTQITDLVAYSDGSNGMGVGTSMKFKTSGPYVAPVIPEDMTGRTDLFGRDSDNPIVLDAVNSGPFNAIGEIGDHLVLVLEVDSTAQPGSKPGETVTFSYLEM